MSEKVKIIFQPNVVGYTSETANEFVALHQKKDFVLISKDDCKALRKERKEINKKYHQIYTYRIESRKAFERPLIELENKLLEASKEMGGRLNEWKKAHPEEIESDYEVENNNAKQLTLTIKTDNEKSLQKVLKFAKSLGLEGEIK